MGQPALQTIRLSFAEYEALDHTAEDTRYEYTDGEIFALSGGSLNHNQLVQNMTFALLNRFRNNGCRIFSETVKLQLQASRRYVYPDVILHLQWFASALSPREYSAWDLAEQKMVKEPTLLVEVLSDRTEKRDLGKKVDYYQALPSLQVYVIIAQDEYWVRVYERSAEGNWLPHRTLEKETDVVRLENLKLELPISEIYEQVAVSDDE